MTKKFQYDGVKFNGRSLYIRGSAEIEWEKDGISSEVGNSWVTQILHRHKVTDVWIDHVEDEDTDDELDGTDPDLIELVISLLVEEQFSRND